MNIYHAMVRYLNAKVHSIIIFIGFLIHKGRVLLMRSLLFFVFSYALFYSIEVFLLGSIDRNKGYDIVMNWEDLDLQPSKVPAMVLSDYEQQRVMHRPNPYYDVRLLWQSLKVSLQIGRMGNAADQMLKVEDESFLRFEAIDFMQNPYRILYVQRGIKLLIRVFWSALALTAIVVGCSLKEYSS